MKACYRKRGAFTLALTMSLAAAVGSPLLAYAQVEPEGSVCVDGVTSPNAYSVDQFDSTRSGAVVAAIGDKEYSSLNDALSGAVNGQTVKVLADTKMRTARVEGKSIALDLNGHTVTVDNRAFNVVSKGVLTLNDAVGSGKLQVNKNSELALGVVTGSGGTFVMNAGAIESPEYGVYIKKDCDGDRVIMNGGEIRAEHALCAIGNGKEHSAKVEITGGKVSGSVFGFSTNGSSSYGGVDLVMSGGTVESTAVDAPAMYLPALRSTAKISGGVVTGGTGIEIRAGELTVSGDASVRGTGPFEANPNGSGSTTSGSAIAVAQHATKQPISVVVGGNAKLKGTFGVYEHNPQNNEAEAIAKVKLSVAGATIETTDPSRGKPIVSADCTGFVSGGSFNTELPSNLIADGRALLVDESGSASVMTEADAIAKAGAAVEKDGKTVYYTSEKAAENSNPSTGGQAPDIKVYVAAVNGAKYTTLEEAIAAAKNGGTVTVMKDLGADEVSAGSQKYINITEADTNVTIDLADHTISLDNNDTISVRASNVDLQVKNGTIVNASKSSYGLYTYKTNDNIKVVFENLTLRTVDQAIGVQGLNSNQDVTLKNCNITCDTTAVYWPPKSGTLTIEDTFIQGKSGVTVKGGKVVVKGSTHIKATGEKNIPDDDYDGSGTLISTGSAIYVESGYNDRDIAVEVQGGTFESVNGATVLYFAKKGESTEAARDIAISGGTFVGEPPAAEFIVPGSGLVVGEDGSLSVVEAKLGFASDKVVDGVLTYDVKGGKASAISKADLLKLVSMNVEGYTVSVDDSALPALNKAVGAADTSLSFSFEFRAAKDAVKTRATSDVAPLVLTVKLTDSTVVPAPEPIQKATVTFDTGIGSSFQQVVEVGSKLERPADPTREGWKFVGWFKSKAANGDVSDEWNFDKDVVNADMTLYGGWVKDAEQPPAKPADPTKPGSKDKLAQTGDASMAAMAATSFAGAAAVAAGALKRRR